MALAIMSEFDSRIFSVKVIPGNIQKPRWEIFNFLFRHGNDKNKSYKLYEYNFTQRKVFKFQQNPDWKL